jgi:uncharacterized PurR-regulated membrane protein YhhQ (DUF165 family)
MAVGIALTLRDLVQRSLGQRAAYLGIGIGAVLSAFVSPALAVASGAAFAIAELTDMGIFSATRPFPLGVRSMASNVAGACIDSAVFLVIGFGPEAVSTFGVAQVLGKFEWSLVALPVLLGATSRRHDRATPGSALHELGRQNAEQP